ncbi:MAG: hypothetical protein WCO65_00840 [bacterium]
MKISVRVKEKIARLIAGQFTTNEIVNVFTDAHISTDVALYAKWRITLDAFGKIPTEDGLFSVLEEFCHPLNFTDLQLRKNFIDGLNQVLSYENLRIQSDERIAKIVPITDDTEEINSEETTKDEVKELPDINSGTFSEKVLELVAEEINNYLTNFAIRKIISPIIEEEPALYNQKVIHAYLVDDLFEENSFYNFDDVLQTIRKKAINANWTIKEIITTLLHPLNHNANEKRTDELAVKLEKYLKYDNFLVERLGNEYIITSFEEQPILPDDVLLEWEEKDILQDKATALAKKDVIEELRKHHQAYMDILEIFCENITHPTKELNSAYLLLKNKIETITRGLSLKHYRINPCKQFKGDLYSAEMEWNGDPKNPTETLGPVLSWDTIRPSLYSTHSEITKLCILGEEKSEMTDEEKQLEEITKLISEQRTKKVTPEKDGVMKIEVLNKYEKNPQNLFYITKNGDDFKYKGGVLGLSKDADYYKTFSALYATRPEGGEIKYEELFAEVKSRIPKLKSKNDEEMRKFIQTNLTDKSNGFLRYAEIAKTEDNGKPLIKIVRAVGVSFNNKMG